MVQQRLQVLAGQFCLGNPRGGSIKSVSQSVIHSIDQSISQSVYLWTISTTITYRQNFLGKKNVSAVLHTKFIALKCDKHLPLRHIIINKASAWIRQDLHNSFRFTHNSEKDGSFSSWLVLSTCLVSLPQFSSI